MKIHTFLLLLLSLVVVALRAGAVSAPSPGALSAVLDVGSLSSGATVVIEGEIDAADVAYLSTVGAPVSLDLSKATIVEYNGAKLANGIVHCDANHLPDYSLVGSSLTSIKLPETLESIGEGVLAGSKIGTVLIPAGVKEIGRNAFSDCVLLKDVTIPVTSIPEGAFKGCVSLSKVTVSEQLASIGSSAFAGCQSLASFVFPPALVAIGDDAFYATALESADLSGCRSLTTIGDRAFADCRRLIWVSLPGSVTKLGKGLFFDDVALSRVVMPDNVKINVLPDYIFKGNHSLGVAQTGFIDNVTVIGDYAMTDMPHVERWQLPASLDSIGTGAMEGWTGLRRIDGDNVTAVPQLGKDVWAGVNQGGVYLLVPEDMVDKFMQADQWREFLVKALGVSETVSDGVTEAGVEIVIDGAVLRVRAAGELRSVTVYDVGGRVVCATNNIESDSADISLLTAQPGILIISVTTVGSDMATVVKRIFKG